MSSSPPPGWYRDPSYPLTERWWDGSAWTDHRRQPEQPPVPPPVRPRPAQGLGRTKAVALAAAGAVLVAGAVTGGVLVLGGDGDGGRTTRTAPSAPSSGDDRSPSPAAPSSSPSGTSGDDASVVVDDLNGITFPVLDGWTDGQDADEDAVLVTDGTYDCPGDDGLCRSGWVYSRTVTQSDETSPKALAENDIEDAANDAYDRDDLDRRPYNGITGHEVVGSGSVAVAGRAGYFVRWRVTPDAGPGGGGPL
ncbi:DUF2510 domain-containing protein, partial [Streptomyces heilongjiangensis]|uniref:DUF2510 domain-containing protein n=1 Tax=Streptomyces heilongjiangensis TaxID=945052 RepID=UPI00232C63AA